MKAAFIVCVSKLTILHDAVSAPEVQQAVVLGTVVSVEVEIEVLFVCDSFNQVDHLVSGKLKNPVELIKVMGLPPLCVFFFWVDNVIVVDYAV